MAEPTQRCHQRNLAPSPTDRRGAAAKDTVGRSHDRRFRDTGGYDGVVLAICGRKKQVIRSASFTPCSRQEAADRLMPADEEIYTDALRFVPERWYARPEMIKEPGACAPFSLGTRPYSLTSWFDSLPATYSSFLLRLFNPPFPHISHRINRSHPLSKHKNH